MTGKIEKYYLISCNYLNTGCVLVDLSESFQSHESRAVCWFLKCL